MADIVLKDRDGNKVNYENINLIQVDTANGESQSFIAGKASEKTVELDFSSGDMVIVPEEGELFTKINIPKPINLISGNVAEDVDIAGILGTLKGVGDNKIKAITKFVTLPAYYTNTTVELISAAEIAEAGLTFPTNAYCFALMFVPGRMFDNDYSNPYVKRIAMCIITNQYYAYDNKTSGAQGNEYGVITLHNYNSSGYHYASRTMLTGNYFTSSPTNGLCYKDGAIKCVLNSSTHLKKNYIVVAGYIEKT